MCNDVYVNDAYLPYLHADQYTQIYFGGSSSGKSYFLAQRCVMDVIEGTNYLVCRNVAKTLRRSVFNEVTKAIGNLGVAERFRINRSDMVITYRQNGKQILFAGLDDTEKLKSITPENGVLEAIWIEEATEAQRPAYLQLKKRLRGVSDKPKKIVLSFNPVLKSHWIYKEFFANYDEEKGRYIDKDLLILKTTYKDNHFLTAEDRYQLENEKDEYFYQVYTLGNWGILGNVIYRNWKVEDLSGRIASFDNIYSGLDFGFTNPTAGVRIQVDVDRKTLYVFQEYYKPQKTDDELAADIRAFASGQTIVCDAEDPKAIYMLATHGVNAVAAKKGADSVIAGIRYILGWQIVIDIHCQNFINEIQQYHFMQDKDGNPLDKPCKKNDHLMDAMRYALEPMYLYGEAKAGTGRL